MSSETPAAHLARLKVTYRTWRIWKGSHTDEWWAAPPPGHPHQILIHAETLPELEGKLIRAEAGRET